MRGSSDDRWRGSKDVQAGNPALRHARNKGQIEQSEFAITSREPRVFAKMPAKFESADEFDSQATSFCSS
jgi:hypothetical protein